MFASFILQLRPDIPIVVNRHVGRYVNGLVYHLLESVSPMLSKWVHDEANPKPFTSSTLTGTFHRINGHLCASPEDLYNVRCTVLRDDVYDAFGQALLQYLRGSGQIRIDSAIMHLESIISPPQHHTLVGAVTDVDLWAMAEPSREIALEFLSPTAFKKEDMHLLFPQPWNVFGSLGRNWRAFSDIPLPMAFETLIENQIAVSRHRVETKSIAGGKYQLIGFIGECVYRIPGTVSEADVRALNALAAFAMYAGVGMKTTQGMGQVRHRI